MSMFFIVNCQQPSWEWCLLPTTGELANTCFSNHAQNVCNLGM